MRVEFHPEADAELATAQTWYSQRSEVAAQAFALEVDNAIRLVAEAPNRWASVGGDEHRFVLPRFPYSIVYRVRADVVYVTAIAHHKRRPGYWRQRE